VHHSQQGLISPVMKITGPIEARCEPAVSSDTEGLSGDEDRRLRAPLRKLGQTPLGQQDI